MPATKATSKELLLDIDKLLIQYAVEEAITAGLDTLIFITGRNKRSIEDHFDENNELELVLRPKVKNEMADMVKNILPEDIECVFVRQITIRAWQCSSMRWTSFGQWAVCITLNWWFFNIQHIFDILRNQFTGVGSEIQLADYINIQAENNMVKTLLLNGKRFDCGNIQGYVGAIEYIASNHKFD